MNIVPHLWFDKEAVEAAKFYTTVFTNSEVTHISQIKDTPSGDCDIVSFKLCGMAFAAISAGPYFKINPSVSFIVNFDPSREKNARENLDAAWEKLSKGGQIMMPLQEYPFSKRFGWIQDKFGVSWQLILTNPEGEPRPEIVPSLLFVNENVGKTEEAIKLYTSIFKDSKMGAMRRYGKDHAPDKEGTVQFADFKLQNLWFAAMDSAHAHKFQFNEAISFMVNCETQKEIDFLWDALTANGGQESMCGWLKDKFGLSWQIVPKVMNEMMVTKDKAASKRVTAAFMKMKKFDIVQLQKAFEGD